jgi:predicted lipoprotein with Yx(FWY)xxD motif
MKRLIPLVALAAIVALVVALSSGGGGKNQNAHAQAHGPYGNGNAPTPSAANSAIGVRNTPLGRVLVDAKGRTIYLFEADDPNKSNCSGACVSIWPPLTSGAKPKATGGALAAKIGTISTSGGKSLVTYNDHSLYYYVGDQKAGDTKGQDLNQFGAGWYVLAPNGSKIDNG